jgi:transposase InsO family protein
VGISRQAYYQSCTEELRIANEHHHVLQWVREQRMVQPRVGTRKLHHLLNVQLAEHQIKLGRDALFRILRDARMLVQPRRSYHKTTNSHHRFYKHPNLLKPGQHQVIPQAPEQVWVADITYLPTQSDNTYLSLVTDAYSRKIVGYHLDRHLHTHAVAKALKMAVRSRISNTSLIHHSDRGVQYCSSEYQALHQRHQITCSMTDGYDCYQNALAERVNGILKNELLLSKPKDLEEARRMVKQSIKIYNEIRPHLSLKYKTPDEVHQAFINTSKTGK